MRGDERDATRQWRKHRIPRRSRGSAAADGNRSRKEADTVRNVIRHTIQTAGYLALHNGGDTAIDVDRRAVARRRGEARAKRWLTSDRIGTQTVLQPWRWMPRPTVEYAANVVTHASRTWRRRRNGDHNDLGAAGTARCATIARMDATACGAYRENLEFYQGRQWPTRARRRDRRLTFNYAQDGRREDGVVHDDGASLRRRSGGRVGRGAASGRGGRSACCATCTRRTASTSSTSTTRSTARCSATRRTR